MIILIAGSSEIALSLVIRIARLAAKSGAIPLHLAVRPGYPN